MKKFIVYDMNEKAVLKTTNEAVANNTAYFFQGTYRIAKADGQGGEIIEPFKILPEGMICKGFHSHAAS